MEAAYAAKKSRDLHGGTCSPGCRMPGPGFDVRGRQQRSLSTGCAKKILWGRFFSHPVDKDLCCRTAHRSQPGILHQGEHVLRGDPALLCRICNFHRVARVDMDARRRLADPPVRITIGLRGKIRVKPAHRAYLGDASLCVRAPLFLKLPHGHENRCLHRRVFSKTRRTRRH